MPYLTSAQSRRRVDRSAPAACVIPVAATHPRLVLSYDFSRIDSFVGACTIGSLARST
jgi:hypothetical protein